MVASLLMGDNPQETWNVIFSASNPICYKALLVGQGYAASGKNIFISSEATL